MPGDTNATNVAHQNLETVLEVSRKDQNVVASWGAVLLFPFTMTFFLISFILVQVDILCIEIICLLLSTQTVVVEEATVVTVVVAASEVEEVVSEVENVVVMVIVEALVVDTRWEEGMIFSFNLVL